MIRNKTAKALIIGACLTLSTMTGVYADTSDVEVKPAIVEEVQPVEEVKYNEEIATTSIQFANNEEALLQKQKEIDEYVFEKNKAELEQKGIFVTHTGVVGDVVEVGIRSYDTKSADYLYEVFGNEMIMVVDGEQAVPLEYVTITVDKSAQSGLAPEQETNFFANMINNIVNWFKNLF